MASKTTKGSPPKDTVKIKYVPKAGQYVKTVVEKGKQTQTWSEDKPNV